MMYAAIDAVDLAGRDEAVRAILLTGAGEHFCSGFDFVARNQEADAASPASGSIQRRLPSQAHRLVPLPLHVQAPVVCAVAGLGRGDRPQPRARRRLHRRRRPTPGSGRRSSTAGFTPDSGATWLLPRRIGEVRGREMIHARPASSDEALEAAVLADDSTAVSSRAPMLADQRWSGRRARRRPGRAEALALQRPRPTVALG